MATRQRSLPNQRQNHAQSQLQSQSTSPQRRSLPPQLYQPRKPTSSSSSKKTKSGETLAVNWHKDIHYAIQSGRWDNVRGNLQLAAAGSNATKNQQQEKPNLVSGFWNKQQQETRASLSESLLKTDGSDRLPLHCALAHRKTAPVDVIRTMIQLQPQTARAKDGRGRLPIHLAVLYEHSVEITGALVDAAPESLSAVDQKGESPLSYAVELAKNDTDMKNAPKSFWMPAGGVEELERWQQEQAERWGVVHYLLLSFAMHPQSLSVIVGGGNSHAKSSQQQQQPMLVEALLYAAPPAVIMLLIGASVMLLSVENKASAFAGSTLYCCIARHYPLPILQALTMQCPPDVRAVKDETGMGLVSAQFISGCFNCDATGDEWTVNEQMLPALENSCAEGELCKDDPAFVDWWHKIEFLVSFCGDTNNDNNGQQEQVKRELLLHHATSNPDVPPKVIQLLIALYPDSITLPNPATNSMLPIHLAAKNPEYIPRLYEYRLMGKEKSALGMLVEAKPESIIYPQGKKLPIHIAISAGKTFNSLQVFLGVDHNDNNNNNNNKACESILEQRDPETGLYPFQQLVAVSSSASTRDGNHWSCIARNKYSHAAWKSLTDREKASAILEVAEAEGVARLSTSFELLRRNPNVISTALVRKKKTASSYRDECGIGMASSHYLSFCFHKMRGGGWRINNKNSKIFATAVRAAKQTGLSRVPAFYKWWQKMKFWIRYCSIPGPPRARKVRKAIPRHDDDYLLHAALTNPDTPPQVIELLLALFPESPQKSVLTSWLPLHIACLTMTYTPRQCEDVEQNSIELILNAFPEACHCYTPERSLPLHLAIQSGRTWEELWYLVEEEPHALKVRDPETKLYPFQMLCMHRSSNRDQQLQYRYVARNWHTESEWRHLSPLEHIREIREAQKGHQLAILSSAYEMLRKEPSVIENYNADYCEPQKTNLTVSEDNYGFDEYIFGVKMGKWEAGDKSDSEQDIVEESETDEDSDIDSEHNAVGENNTDTSPTLTRERSFRRNARGLKKASLKGFFSREKEKSQVQEQNVYECDASVISSLDVMSLVSGVGPTHRPRRGGRRIRQNSFEEDDGKNRFHRARSVKDLFGEQSNDDTTNSDDNEDEDEDEDSTVGFFEEEEEQEDSSVEQLSGSSGSDDCFVSLADLVETTEDNRAEV